MQLGDENSSVKKFSYILVLMLISHNLRRNTESTRITLVYKVQFLCGPPFFSLWIQEHDRYYQHIVNTIKSTAPQCMINIFMEGEEVVDGEGVAVKDA